MEQAPWPSPLTRGVAVLVTFRTINSMTRRQTTLPLFNRIVVLVMSLMAVIIIPVGVIQEFRQNDGLDVVQGFLFLVFFTIGCAGVWLSLFWRNCTPEELADEASFPSADRPEIPQDAIVYRFSNGVKPAAVYVDNASRAIHFYNCHAPRRFLASSSEWFSCGVDAILGAHVFRYRGESLTIVTTQGKALISATGLGYEELRDTVRELVPCSRPGFSTDHPMMGMVYLFGAIVGLFGGVLLTPRNASDATLGLFVLVGTIAGVAGSYLLVWAADRFLRKNLAQPIGFGVLGSGVGLLASRWLVPLTGWNTLVMAVFVLIGGVAGAVFGIQKQRREQGQAKPSGDLPCESD